MVCGYPSRARANARAGPLRREPRRWPGSHRLVPTGEREGAGEPAVWRVRSEVLLYLLDGRAAAEAFEMPDELDVREVAGGQRIRVAAAVVSEALERPGADLGDCQ